MSTVSGLEIANMVEREWRDRLEAAVKAEREKIAAWMVKRGYSTGHGDTIEDLLAELEWQIAENWTNALVKGVEGEREACAKVCEAHTVDDILVGVGIAKSCADSIRARSKS